MRIKWGKRSFTCMIIPDANSRVVRFRLSAMLLYLIPVMGLIVLCLTLFINITGMQSLNTQKEIAIELADKTVHYEEALTNKEQTIEELQNKIVLLSQQTEEMKLKVEELKILEEEIRSLSSSKPAETDNREVSISSFAPEDAEVFGIGGLNDEANDEDINLLISDTRLTLHHLTGDVGSLKEQLIYAKDLMIKNLHLMKITPSIWPTLSNTISSRYGYRKDPFSRRAAFHSGLDISGNSGDPIYTAADGVVINAAYDRAYGYNVIVKHASGVSTRYGHMKKILVKKGQPVQQGEKIGLLGSTGRSTGPHLHYEVIKKGKTIDPMPYLLSARKGDH
jgi:murein DD-endopeptidase MepM/ murein hydrolase activator NlpD